MNERDKTRKIREVSPLNAQKPVREREESDATRNRERDAATQRGLAQGARLTLCQRGWTQGGEAENVR